MNDVRIIALIGADHMVSHFLQLTLPPLFPLLAMDGWFLDRGEPRAMFAVVAALMLLMIFTVVEVRRRVAPRPSPLPGG